MGLDARPSATAIRKPVDSPEDVQEDLALAYEKGKTVLRMVEMWIGEEAFRRGVLDYIEAHAWGNTVARDLFDALSAAADTDVTPVLASFIEQPGFPLVSVDFADESGVVTLTQRRFHNQGVESEPQKWTVPVRLKYSNGSEVLTRTVLLDGESERVELGSRVEWMHPNAGAYGYYRWQAPADVMYYMAENPEVMDARERATFLSNADALLDAGAFSGDEYLAVLSAVAKSPEPESVSSVVASLGSVEDAFVTPELKDAFAVYVAESLHPALDRIGMEPKAGEPEAATLLRPRLLGWLGMRGRDVAVRSYCEGLAVAYLEDPSSVDSQLAGAALRVAAYFGDRALYDSYIARLEAAEDPNERRRLLGCIGTFQRPEVQQAALDYAVGGNVRLNEMWGVFGPMMQTPAGRDKVYNWVTTNYDEIMSKMPPMMAQYMPFVASGCSAERLEAARAFFGDPARSSEGVEKTLAKVEDQVMDCVNLRAREGAAVAEYLKGFESAQ
jgi:alanyl aminopeptidase